MYTVGLNTSGFEKGSKKVDDTRKKMQKNYESYSKRQVSLNARLQTTVKQRLKAEEALNKAQLEGEKNLTKYIDTLDFLIKKEEDLRLQQAKLSLAFKENFKSAEQAKFNFASLKKSLSPLAVAGGAVAAAFATLKVTADKLDSLGKRAGDFNMTATALYELQHQASLAGVESNHLDDALKTLTERAGENHIKFKELGVELKKTNGETKNTGELLIEVAEKLDDFSTNTESAKIATELFGGEGLSVMRMLKDNKDALKEAFNKNTIDEATKAAAEFNDNLENLAHSIMPSVYNYAGKIIDGFNALKAFWVDGKSYYEYVQDKLNAQTEAQNKQIKIEENRKEAIKYQKKLEEERNQIAQRDLEYQKNLTKESNTRLGLESSIADSISEEYAALTKALDAEKKEAERAQKEAEALKLKREEYDLELKISILENGTDAQKAQAESMKNAIERNRLMKEYGFSIEEATNRLRAQKELENKGNVKYSQSDIEKAKKILERGEGGTVGKKTLEQAQAIVGGNEIQGDRVSIFKNVSAQSQRLQFADAALKESSAVKSSAATKSQASASNASAAETGSDNTENLINQILNKLNVLDDIKTNFNTLLKNYKLKTA